MNRTIKDALLDELIPVPDKFVKAEEIRSALEAKGFKISYWENGGIYKTLIMIFLQIYEELVHLLRFVLFNVYLKTAGDAWLDVKASDFSRYRKEALKTKGQVTLRRSQAGSVIEIPKGYIFKTEADSKGNEYRFIVQEKQFMKAHETEVKIQVTAEHEGEEYNVPPGKIIRCLQYIGDMEITNEKDWITREGSTREDDESLRERTVDWWDELAQLPTGPKYRAIALKVPGVMQCYVDDLHPRGQGTVDIILIGAAGVPTEALIASVKKEVEKVRGPYDDIEYVSPTEQMTDVSVEIFIDKLIDDTNVKALAKETIENLLKNVRGRSLNHLYRAKIIDELMNIPEIQNVKVLTPEEDIIVNNRTIIRLQDCTIAVKRV